MQYFERPGVPGEGNTSVSDLIEQWIGEQMKRGDRAVRDRPRIGVAACSSVLRDDGWPVYAADASTTHAILEAGGFPCLIPLLPLVEGYDPYRLLVDDHVFARCFEVLWPLVRDLDGLVLCGGGGLSARLYGQQPHAQTETPDPWRDV